ncbi:MAG: hypothetical protein ACYCZX_00800 [Rhodospirillaceae bacterium]
MIKMPEQQKEWSKKRAESLAEDLDILLGDLCVIWGLCGGLTGWELTHEGKTITAEAFAHAVVALDEDIDPAAAAGWLPKISAVFVERYGPVVSAKGFRPLGT